MSDISYEVNGRRHTGYLARTAGSQPAPGVLVIHEATGLGAHAKRKADALAKLGYHAFAADLFGEPVTSMDKAMSLIRQLTENWQDLRERGHAGLAVLRDQPGVDAQRLAAIGFCFGGQSVLELSRSGAPLRAVVGFHSALTTLRPEDSKQIRGRVLVCLGDSDPLVPREARDGFMANMTDSRVDCQLLLMSGVGHSFTNPEADALNIPGIRYDAKAEQRAWSAMQGLFQEVF